MAFLNNLFGKKQSTNPKQTNQKYAIRCWVNDGMFPFAGGLIISDNRIEFNLNYPFANSVDPMANVLQKGMYTPLCAPNKYDSAPYLMEDIEKISLNEGWGSSEPRIEMMLNNKSRGTKINLKLVIDKGNTKEDYGKVRQVYDILLEKKK